MLDLSQDRYDRQQRIWWWDQARLANARVLVVGAGALGNEIVKNLALVGVGEIDIVDMDAIEHSNLARCALFRDEDEGRMKAEVLADAASAINPDVTATAFTCPVQHLGSAWLARYTVVIAGLDNREARLWVNAACRRLGLSWVDGAIEGLQGLVRVFGADGPCYECTLGEADLQALSHRRSCALLAPEEIAAGHTPTNATTASVVGGLQVQEAIKLIVGRDDLVALTGRVWRLEGETMLTSVVEYQEDPDCLAHDRIEEIVPPPRQFDTLGQAVAQISKDQGAPVQVVYLSDDLIVVEACDCGGTARTVGLRSVLAPGAGRCRVCASELEISERSALTMDDPLADVDWEQWEWPREEFIAVSFGGRIVHASVEAGRG